MKPNDIKAGMRCAVGWFYTSASSCVRRDYLAHGKIVFRRGGRVKFKWESGDTMDCDFIATPHYSSEYFWVNVMDIRPINEVPIREWEKQTAPQPTASL